jgi:Lrp/AsnC family leucine-responsive transcriptional regulator
MSSEQFHFTSNISSIGVQICLIFAGQQSNFGDSCQKPVQKGRNSPIRVLDEIDLRIIAALQKNAKATANELAEAVGLSPSPCTRRVRLLEDAGVIKGYTVVVDQKKLGLPISAFASIKLERQREDDLDRFSQAVSRWPEVVDCYLMTGQRDYLMRIVVRDLEAYERFIKDKLTRLDNIASIETSFALGQVKRSEVLPMQA